MGNSKCPHLESFPYSLARLVQPIVQLAIQAGCATLPYWQQTKTLAVTRKADNSPLTQADVCSHQVITAGLAQLTPDLPVISEEGDSVDYAIRRGWPYYWLLDPLDGTRGFIQHCSEYSVNIALVRDHNPILGVIYVPVTEECYFAWEAGGAFKQTPHEKPDRLQVKPQKGILRIIIGQSHSSNRLKQFLTEADFPYQILHLNSSLKFGWLAEGKADIYPRLGPTSEWDTGAGQCILHEAGGVTVDFRQEILQYNRKTSLLNPEFLAVADSGLIKKWANILSQEMP